jgi:hypothetical protein
MNNSELSLFTRYNDERNLDRLINNRWITAWNSKINIIVKLCNGVELDWEERGKQQEEATWNLLPKEGRWNIFFKINVKFINYPRFEVLIAESCWWSLVGCDAVQSCRWLQTFQNICNHLQDYTILWILCSLVSQVVNITTNWKAIVINEFGRQHPWHIYLEKLRQITRNLYPLFQFINVYLFNIC